ncbi:hypothetical protein V6N13_092525 [Hibiscus sabdariffa]
MTMMLLRVTGLLLMLLKAEDTVVVEDSVRSAVANLPSSSGGSRKNLVKGSSGAMVIGLQNGVSPAVTAHSLTGNSGTHTVVLFQLIPIPHTRPRSGPSGGEMPIDPGDHVVIRSEETTMACDNLIDGVIAVGIEDGQGNKENHVPLQ